MKRRFILYRRKRGGIFYVEDTVARKQESLGTRERSEALAMVNARNEAIRQPHLNLQIAKAYLAGTDSAVSSRTWQNALDAVIDTKSGSSRDRWRRAAKETALDLIRDRVIIETQAEHLLAALKAGTVSTNVHLRKLRNFYELCLHLGGSQSDIANLKAEDIDWPDQTIAYARRKTGSLAMIHFGPDIEATLRRLNATGYLFPYLQSVRSGDRATEFKQRCEGLGIKGVTLHSYRYAWAERAKTCGY